MNLLVRLREVRRLLRQDRGDRVGRRVAAERPLPRQHLVEDRPEREDVRARVGGPAADLLGRHVAHRPEHDAGLGSRNRPQVGLRSAFLLRLELRETEVEDLDPAVPRQKDVLGFQVPVDDPLLVRRRESLGELDRIVRRLADGDRARGDPLAQRLPLEQLGDDVGRPVHGADVVDRGDVRVIEHPGRPRLLLEAVQPVGILREERGQHLDRHLAPQARVLRPIDLPHPSRADRREDLVGAELGSGGKGHSGAGDSNRGSLRGGDELLEAGVAAERVEVGVDAEPRGRCRRAKGLERQLDDGAERPGSVRVAIFR